MKLELEVMGRMFQDWVNEIYRWDTDNILKISLGGTLVYSGPFKDLTETENDDSTKAATEAVEALRFYTFDTMRRCSLQTQTGNTEHVAYAYCDVDDTEDEISIKYGKFHLKREVDVADDFKLSDLAFVRLENFAAAIQSGDPYFASLICCPGHGEIALKEVASNIKDEYDCHYR